MRTVNINTLHLETINNVVNDLRIELYDANVLNHRRWRGCCEMNFRTSSGNTQLWTVAIRTNMTADIFQYVTCLHLSTLYAVANTE